MVVYKYQIWDTAGQEKINEDVVKYACWQYRALAPMYYRGAAAAIIVYDITQENSFKAVKSWIRELKQYADADIVLAIAGNKSDLEELREIQYKDAQDYADLQDAVFIETSAKTAVNVSALFLEISKRLSKRVYRPQAFVSGEDTASADRRQPLYVPPNSATSKRSCC